MGSRDWTVSFDRTRAERGFDSGANARVERYNPGRGAEWEWSLSCGYEEVDSGSTFSMRSAMKAAEDAEKARQAHCDRNP